MFVFIFSWKISTSLRFFNIIVTTCDVHFENLLYIFKVYRTVILNRGIFIFIHVFFLYDDPNNRRYIFIYIYLGHMH